MGPIVMLAGRMYMLQIEFSLHVSSACKLAVCRTTIPFKAAAQGSRMVTFAAWLCTAVMPQTGKVERMHLQVTCVART